MLKNQGMKLVEVIVVMVVCIVVNGLVAAVMLTPSRNVPMQSRTQMRGIHQVMQMYSDGNNGHYPGLKHDGTIADATVEGRFQLLLESGYFTGEYVISPHEVQAKSEWTNGRVTVDNYSFAMLRLDEGEANRGRLREWSSTLNSNAMVLSDRNTGSSTADGDVTSLLVQNGGEWNGNVAWNAGHVTPETSHIQRTKYTGGNWLQDAAGNAADHMFRADDDSDGKAGYDAHMVHQGVDVDHD